MPVLRGREYRFPLLSTGNSELLNSGHAIHARKTQIEFLHLPKEKFSGELVSAYRSSRITFSSDL